MVELLAPAGRLENIYFAFHYGADAVYFGGQQYSLRANAKNLNLEEIKKATTLAHKLGKKVYVAVNIVFHDTNFEGLEEYLTALDKIGIDAIIASDISVVMLAYEKKYKFEVHLSTQASVLNSKSALFWQNLGVKRIVLAREAGREDIIAIKEKTNLDLEVFIHGAMCTSFSGKCVLSNYTTGRDANRGGCAQICRWNFACLNKPDLLITPKDLNMVPFIKDMMDKGIKSFKIEGRMRSIYYIATVILVYRRIIDKIIAGSLTKEEETYYLNILNRCANRDSTPQFYDKLPGVKEQYFNGRDEASNQDFLGLVLDYDAQKQLAKIEERNYFAVGDKVQFFGPNTQTLDLTITKMYDEEMHPLTVARHPQMIVYIEIEKNIQKDDMMRLKVFDIL